MGYYTNYSLNILKDPDNKIEEFKKELEDIFTPHNINDLLDSYLEAKWYDWSTYMEEKSKKFPNMLFFLSGEGEEPLDVWNCYFCNGEPYYREIQVSWEPFDEKEFYKHNKS